ncbi:hypothetical protein pah_c047o077 [Parachlamydia acanthamoebae str. Hall's coccus]|nr:hypothetical protein pah_c047o077 [Parachlamydia acanthamoebae str. Hall's coccus]
MRLTNENMGLFVLHRLLFSFFRTKVRHRVNHIIKKDYR